MWYMYRCRIESTIILQTNHRIEVLAKRRLGTEVITIALVIVVIRQPIQVHLRRIPCITEVRFITLEMDILTVIRIRLDNPV